jgi:hypothetical protein
MSVNLRATSYLILALVLCAGRDARAVCDVKQPSAIPSSRYVLHGGQAYDTQTGLTWQRCSLGQTWKEGSGCVGEVKHLPWNDAVAQVPAGWRLPTKDEIATLVSPACRRPALNDEVFPNMDTENLWYWTGTPSNKSSFAWHIILDDGFVDGRGLRKDPHGVLLVHDDKPEIRPAAPGN